MPTRLEGTAVRGFGSALIPRLRDARTCGVATLGYGSLHLLGQFLSKQCQGPHQSNILEYNTSKPGITHQVASPLNKHLTKSVPTAKQGPLPRSSGGFAPTPLFFHSSPRPQPRNPFTRAQLTQGNLRYERLLLPHASPPAPPKAISL